MTLKTCVGGRRVKKKETRRFSGITRVGGCWVRGGARVGDAELMQRWNSLIRISDKGVASRRVASGKCWKCAEHMFDIRARPEIGQERIRH